MRTLRTFALATLLLNQSPALAYDQQRTQDHAHYDCFSHAFSSLWLKNGWLKNGTMVTPSGSKRVVRPADNPNAGNQARKIKLNFHTARTFCLQLAPRTLTTHRGWCILLTAQRPLPVRVHGDHQPPRPSAFDDPDRPQPCDNFGKPCDLARLHDLRSILVGIGRLLGQQLPLRAGQHDALGLELLLELLARHHFLRRGARHSAPGPVTSGCERLRRSPSHEQERSRAHRARNYDRLADRRVRRG